MKTVTAMQSPNRFRRVLALLVAALREIFDESAYSRFLDVGNWLLRDKPMPLFARSRIGQGAEASVLLKNHFFSYRSRLSVKINLELTTGCYEQKLR